MPLTQLPQIQYPAVSPTVTYVFPVAPVKKPGAYPTADLEGVGASSVSVSGQRQVMWFRTDTFYHLIMDYVPWADMISFWNAFIAYATQGGTFLYWPDSGGTSFDEYWLEDPGGSSRNSNSNTQLYAWNPKQGERQWAQFELILRKKPGGLTHP